jgi:hypothetical protein
LRGYSAQSTSEAGNLGLPDEAQLIFAAERGMVLFTYNVQDFIPLARAWFLDRREHAGIVLSDQMSRRRFGELRRRVLRFLNTLTAEEMYNRIIFLQQFK